MRQARSGFRERVPVLRRFGERCSRPCAPASALDPSSARGVWTRCDRDCVRRREQQQRWRNRDAGRLEQLWRRGPEHGWRCRFGRRLAGQHRRRRQRDARRIPGHAGRRRSRRALRRRGTPLRGAAAQRIRLIVVRGYRREHIASFAAFALLESCSASATYVVVSVSTDLPGSTLQLTARVRRAGSVMAPSIGGAQRDSFSVARPAVRLADGVADLGTFAVLPSRDAPGEGVELELSVSAGAMTTVQRRARIAFVQGRGQQVRVVLRARCAAAAVGCTTVPAERCTTLRLCEERDQTCGDDGTCVVPTVTTMPIGPGPDASSGRCPDPDRCVARECQVPVARCVDGRTECVLSMASAGTQCSRGVCDGAGQCTSCGGVGDPCCGAACQAGLECRGGRCEACGGLSQACCGTACRGGLECNAGRCDSCGGSGERCCGGGFCTAPRACAGDRVCR